jgi:outer membrane biogenesis lipoprotein LolB
VPDTQDARDHAAEAEQIEQDLLGYRVPVEKIAPTLDGSGHIRLNFDAAVLILDMLDHAYQGIPPQLD